MCYTYRAFHSLTTAVTHTRAKLLNPMAVGEEICNLFGTRQRGFQVGMKHGVAEEQKSCVFRFWHSHVHTRLLHSGVTPSGLLLYIYIYTHRKNGFGKASRTRTCLLSNVKHEAVTFHKTASTHNTPLQRHTKAHTQGFLGHFPQT